MPLVLAHSPALNEGRVLAKAAFRASALLGLSQKELAVTIGVSPASVSRMKDGSFQLVGKPFELVACLVRVFRSLDAIIGGDRGVMRALMRAENSALSGIPRALVVTAPGLVEGMQYLDAARAPL